MSHRDPTLPRPDTDALPESALIERVKTEQDSTALMELVTRHTGLYFDVVHRYAATYPNVIKTRDLDDDKLFNIYQFILAYDPTRGMKLSTYIGDRTDYLCKTLLKRDMRNPISAGTYAPTGAMPFDTDEDTYATTNGAHVTLEDNSRAADVAENANLDLGIEEIRAIASQVCTDPRFDQILTLRHFGPDHHTMSWRDVGQKVGISHERARQVYLQNLALVRAQLEEKV